MQQARPEPRRRRAATLALAGPSLIFCAVALAAPVELPAVSRIPVELAPFALASFAAMVCAIVACVATHARTRAERDALPAASSVTSGPFRGPAGRCLRERLLLPERPKSGVHPAGGSGGPTARRATYRMTIEREMSQWR